MYRKQVVVRDQAALSILAVARHEHAALTDKLTVSRAKYLWPSADKPLVSRQNVHSTICRQPDGA